VTRMQSGVVLGLRRVYTRRWPVWWGASSRASRAPSSQCDVAVKALPGHPAAAVVSVSSTGWPNST
jgi:hypothetical protein